MDPTDVKWTTTEFSLQGFVTSFRNAFPNLIKITVGFLGKQEIDSVSSSTVIRVHSHCVQQRVAAETKNGILFSLSTKLTRLKFLVLGDRRSTNSKMIPLTLEEILARYNLPLSVRLSSACSYTQKGDQKSQDELLSELKLLQTYEESFLLGHQIDTGKIFTEDPIIIPMYMKELRLVVAMGFQNGDNIKWKIACDSLTRQVKHKGDITDVTCEEIYMLDKKNISPQEPCYSTIEPIYIDISEVNDKNKTPLDNKGKYNVYQMHPVPLPKPVVRNQSQNAACTESPAAKNFSSFNDIPKDLRLLSVNQVCQCLRLLNMNQYVEAFQTSQVDGQMVYDLDPDMMKSCLGMNQLNALKLLKFRDGWRPNVQN
ncbi:uncharacterized protein LOC130368746 [Hyla sarda]|uniref:uncharacterized protein LOC130368746 n=1 Tax=Hyla sarda TaxID=327740 RepID=UPI0024C36DDE|nr:uncharacterized protein LOC130368746 [Hyla sarda]XP_056428872.1 uncharacterized protein LOC130368746 [Hyla sarda]